MVERPLGEMSAGGARHTLPAIPSSVPIIRHELDRVLDQLNFPPKRAADIRLALTEACTNAVQHAYPDGSQPGHMVIAFDVSPEALSLSVRDSGRGIEAPSPHPGFGVGFQVIDALADSVTVTSLRPGTRVQMTFGR
jgi:serine/threonine-protein kinase RsbW